MRAATEVGQNSNTLAMTPDSASRLINHPEIWNKALPQVMNTPTYDAERFVAILHKLGWSRTIKNIQTDIQIITLDGQPVPITVNDEEYDNSYVCSPYTAYISYAKDELGLLRKPLLQWGLKGLIGWVSLLLKLAKINRTVSINNWLVSTNLIPDWSFGAVQEITKDLLRHYPQHSLSIRSLNAKTNSPLMDRLIQQGWELIPARQVYLFDNHHSDWSNRKNVKNDGRLLAKTPLTWVKPADLHDNDFGDMEDCYQQLFIKKHSHLNPQFTAEFFRELHQAGLVEFHGFRNADGRIIASIGLFTQQDTITTPIVGYDTRQPKELGLYRLVMALLLKLAKERGQMLNLSSGAADFKRQRGGEPVIEYTAFYVQHLSAKRRWALQCFSRTLNHFGPHFLQKHGV